MQRSMTATQLVHQHAAYLARRIEELTWRRSFHGNRNRTIRLKAPLLDEPSVMAGSTSELPG